MGADIASLSLGGEHLAAECGGFDPYTSGFCRAIAQGLLVFASAGNDAIDSIYKAPANMPGVITVSALGDFDGIPGGEGGPQAGCSLGYYQADDQLAFFSNWGSQVDVIAPGVCILAVLPGNQWGFTSGTSPATPFAVGVTAAFMIEYPDCDGQDAWKAVLGYSKRPEWVDGLGVWDGDKGPDKEPLIRYVTTEAPMFEENPCKIPFEWEETS
jgi:subtilisin family serine protease